MPAKPGSIRLAKVSFYILSKYYQSAKLAAVGCLTVCWCADARQPTSVANATCRNLDSDGRLTVRPSAMRGMQAWRNWVHMGT
ncbi:hypothetical protein LSAT2_011167 [Lamellibrachia satsuma]|nr:hypothetical protein LSAT2_011167 [Lamellibrachia satsuma]